MENYQEVFELIFKIYKDLIQFIKNQNNDNQRFINLWG
jgi:hypothetical protein